MEPALSLGQVTRKEIAELIASLVAYFVPDGVGLMSSAAILS
jgi:putative effector of murein hydrolase LrgA (UPF0299 family)